MAYPDAAVQAQLVAVVPGLVAEQNCRLGAPVPVEEGTPGDCVFVVATGGPVNDRFLGIDSDHRISTVQVTVRSEHYSRAEGLATARACLEALHCATLAGYYGCVVREPDPTPAPAKRDEGFYFHWTLNCELRRVT